MRILKTLIVAVLAAGIFTGCAPAMVPPIPREIVHVSPPTYSLPHSSLKKQIDEIIEKELLPYASAGIKVVSLQKGDTLYEYNARLLQPPASVQKLFTAATALTLLGKDKEAATTVAFDPEAGSIYLKGCGDAMLTGDDLAELAGAAARNIDHDKDHLLLADLTCFDDIYWGKGWMWDDEPDPSGMYISPLSVNHNTITVRVSPGKAAGKPAVVSVSPRTALVTVDNGAATGVAGQRGSIRVTRNPGDRDNLVTVSGTISEGASPAAKRLSVRKPELIALGLFRDALSARGIAVAGTGIAGTPAGIPVVARKGRAVRDLVRFMLKRSDNLSAESLLKLIALEATNLPGSADAGSKAVMNYLDALHVPVDNLVVADGSGLSRYNLTNAETIIRLLEHVYRDRSIYPPFYDSLPVAGKDGTLAKRMRGTAAEGILRGKTGTLSGIAALAGYLSTAEKEPLAFSIIIQNYPGPPERAGEILDRIGVLLCSFRR